MQGSATEIMPKADAETPNSIAPQRGVVTLVGHGIRRLVVIGSEGMVSLAALRWLADQDVAFSMLERDGKVLAVTGPVRSSDAKLRRAQALAHSSGPHSASLVSSLVRSWPAKNRLRVTSCWTTRPLTRLRN